MKIALLQLNYIVGDIEGNAQKIINSVKTVCKKKIDLCICSELAISGYPPRDLLLKNSFIEKTLKKVDEIAKAIKNCSPLLIGAIDRNPSNIGNPLYNSAFLLNKGKVTNKFHKILLPTYDVFDEDRYFESGEQEGIFELNGKRIGVTICEDIWNEENYWHLRRYKKNPLKKLSILGVDYLINLSASPFCVGKEKFRKSMLSSLAKKYKAGVVYVNQVGGNDDLVFDGRSCVLNSGGKLIAECKSFQEDILIVDLAKSRKSVVRKDLSNESEIWNALVLGTRDYIQKCGFKKAVLGLSGGIDSAITAAIASEAIGYENVLGVLMPSPYSSIGSIDDSLDLARNLKIKTVTLPISNIMKSFDETLADAFHRLLKDKTEENIQARIRGNILMALSNKFNAMLLSTGNKSELAVGYCTIYGDMAGGLAVIADVPKTMIYKLADWLNKTKKNIIPKIIIEKAPSAELRPNQTDQDSLPPYEILDKILFRHIELNKSTEEITAEGFDKATVEKITKLVYQAEFKRKQASTAIKISNRAFSSGWRMPIAYKA